MVKLYISAWRFWEIYNIACYIFYHGIEGFAMARFGEILAELRQEQKLTQKELAHKMFVTVGTISNYETGVHFPDVEKLIELADYFGVTTDYLLGRCEVDFSPDVFSENISGDRTVGKFIQDVRGISADRRHTLIKILDDMKLATVVRQYNAEK